MTSVSMRNEDFLQFLSILHMFILDSDPQVYPRPVLACFTPQRYGCCLKALADFEDRDGHIPWLLKQIGVTFLSLYLHG